MVKMSNLLSNLNSATLSLDEDKVIYILKHMLTEPNNVEINNNDIFLRLLKIDNKDVCKLSTELIAELAKTEANRNIMTNTEVINTLIDLLVNSDDSIIIHAIRALGNICYENEEACNIINKIGIGNILIILKRDSERQDSLITCKSAGLLVNLISLHDGLSMAALKSEIFPLLDQLLLKYIQPFKENQILLKFLLSVQNSLSDYIDELNIPFSERLYQTVVDIFKISTNAEISVICLEIFHGQSEKDEMKILLTKEGVCELLLDLIEKYRHTVDSEETRCILKMACDLIVIILTEDYSMCLLYHNGEGLVYLNMISWLDSDDSDLLCTGVLAIGNFARKDINCIQMVQNGVSKKLLELLTKYNHSIDIADVKIQHALLSTFKNLVIPPQNKARILQEGLIEVIYPMIHIKQSMVIFKLLGTFRMVIDEQEAAALELISRIEFLEKVVHWYYNSEHLGVRGEAPRLLSWLIKHCHSFRPFKNFMSVKDSIKCIVETISSDHAVMQNEALFALNLLCIGCSDSNYSPSSLGSPNGEYVNELTQLFMDQIVAADVGNILEFVVAKHGDKMDKNTINNLLTLLEQVTKSKVVIDHLNSNSMNEVLFKLAANPNASSVSDKLNKIGTKLTK